VHSVDVDTVGLADLGKGVDYASRQAASWQRQAEHHRQTPNGEADRVYARLLERMPAQSEVTLVHGDYRLDNAVFTPNGNLRAVLDWELCTRGDPLVDLGVFLYYWTEPGDPVRPFDDPATTEWGWPGRREILAEYEAVSGRSVGRINWYLGYAAWRLATVFEGVRGRSAHGAYGDPDAAELSRLGLVVDSLVGHATGLLDEDSRADRDQMG
jgi:aminoglycoside phosphotransferase (APT) family kinase protein